jgi:hypothetical protein
MKKEMIIMMLLFATIAVAQQMPLLTYTPLSDATRKSSQSFQRHDKIPAETRKTTLNGAMLEVKIPLKANAYDVILIHYKFAKSPYGAGRLSGILLNTISR